MVRVKRTGTARVVGCVDTKELAGESSAEIPPGVKFLGSLRTYRKWCWSGLVLTRSRLASAEGR